ncbi:MAG: hypothetical protein AB8F78_17305 [Saprospiraceae bacterium]
MQTLPKQKLHSWRILVLFCLLPMLVGQAMAQSTSTREVTPETLDSLRSFLNRSESQRFMSFEQVMLKAEKAYDRKEYAEVQQFLSRATIAGVPNSRWFEMRYLTFLGQDKPEAAQQALVEGFSTYPYAENLARLVGNQQLEGNATRNTFLKAKYPTNVRFELAAKLAFQQGDVISGLLDAEQAFYSDDKLQLDTDLRKQLLVFYRGLLLAKGDTEGFVSNEIYADSSFAKAYLDCLSDAARKVYKAAELSEGEIFDNQFYLSRVRVSALRIYAEKGHLGRWQHPLLVDLYVLDKAGYFDEASMILLDLLDPEVVEAYQKENPGKLRQTVKYLNEDWANDVDAFISSF